MSGDKLCNICGDRPPAKGRKICETCKKQKQREKNDPQDPVKSVIDKVLVERNVQRLEEREAREPRHAVRCTSVDPGAIWRPTKQGQGDWVIPGAHYVGKTEPYWTSCLNPDCISPL